MSRLLDRTIVTKDEESAIEFKIRVAELLDRALNGEPLDTYNEQYVLRLTLDKTDEETDDAYTA